MKETLENAHKFKLWKSNLEKNGLKINQIEEKFTRYRYNGEVLFSLLMLDAETPEGDKIPPVCFLKGEVVSILICLIDEETSEKYLILVKQRRIAEGGFTYEHPAGMVDSTTTPAQIALQEVKEETGIEISPDQLHPLEGGKRLFPSTGTSDECMYFYLCELTLPKTEIDALSNRNMGTDYEFERIITEVLPFEEAHKKLNNTNGLLLNYLYLSQIKDWDLIKKL